MLHLSAACLFFKSHHLQYRQQCIFWELVFLKSKNLESKLCKKWKLQFFHPKGNLMFYDVEAKHRIEIHLKYSKDNPLTPAPPLFKVLCISEELWFTLGIWCQKGSPKSFWTNPPFTELLYTLLVWQSEQGDLILSWLLGGIV